MISKRTIIGIAIGSVIVAIGLASLLFLHIGLLTIEVNDTLDLGEPVTYRISAPEHTPQTMKVTGESFDLRLQSPADGLQIPLTPHKKEVSLDWVHLANGETVINIQNTGSDEVNVVATFQKSTDPIFITYDIMVIISGMVIMGFSLGFSIRKPRGF